MKKRLLLIFLALALTFGLVACGDKGEGNSTDTGSGDTSQNQTSITPADVFLFGGDEDYTIVYSGTANDAVKDLIVQMSSKVKDVTGSNPKRIADNAKTEKETPKEIVIASTTRSASAESMKKISGIGYRVEFIGEKLVITASNDTILKSAVQKLFDTWKTEDGKIILHNTTVLTEDLSNGMLPLYENGEFKYKIVIQASAKASVFDAAEDMSGRISTLTGKSVGLNYDTMFTESADAFEICIGKTNRAASDVFYSSLESAFEYRVSISENKIHIGSNNDDALAKAINAFSDYICSEIYGTYCGTPAIDKNYSLTGTLSETLNAFPLPSVGTSRGMMMTGDDEYVMYYQDITQNDYQSYVSTLTSNGCVIDETYEMGGNRYTLMESETYSVYVACLSKVGAMRIILGKPDKLQPEPAAPVNSNVCTPALWQLEVDNKGSGANGGMSYVIRLTDGTFMVIDGGYNTNTEADNLYNLLKENTVGGGEPVISAWFITHLHVDHWGGLKNFSMKYSDKVDVKAFYYNFPRVELGDVGPSAQKNVEGYMNKWKNAKKYASLHSGMNFSVADAKITVICTFEDVFPQPINDGNDTTTVFKVEVGGQSIMFLGDAYYGESATMSSQIDASVLKSDIVQVSHHGYEGCSEGVYRAIGAKVVLWPMNIVGYEGSTPSKIFKKWYEGGPSANAYFRNNPDIKKIIVAGAGTAKLDLPYTATGEKLPDYNKIFQDRTQNGS